MSSKQLMLTAMDWKTVTLDSGCQCNGTYDRLILVIGPVQYGKYEGSCDTFRCKLSSLLQSLCTVPGPKNFETENLISFLNSKRSYLLHCFILRLFSLLRTQLEINDVQ